MSTRDVFNQAASEAVRAVEDSKRSAASAAERLARASSLTELASKQLSTSALSTFDAAAVRRSLGALSGAANKLKSSGDSAVRQAAERLAGKARDAEQAVKAVSGSPAAAPTAAVSSLALTARKAARAALPLAAASGGHHLLELAADSGARYYFGLKTAAFDRLRRQASFNVAVQERLSRPEALQAVSVGGETLSVSGVIFTALHARGRELSKLRELGRKMVPLLLTTGHGEVLGKWYMTGIEEEQEGIMPDGAPRKQTFSLEFKRYGDDYKNV